MNERQRQHLKKFGLYPLYAWLMERGIEANLREHYMWTDEVLNNPALVEIDKKHPGMLDSMTDLSSPHQIIAKGPMGEVSIIRGGMSQGQYEIYSNDKLFVGIRRYNGLEDVGKTVVSLVTEGTFDETAIRAADVWTDFLMRDGYGADGPVQPVDFEEFGGDVMEPPPRVEGVDEEQTENGENNERPK